MRIGLLTDGGYPFVSGEARLWCDRLVRGLDRHAFDIYALSRSAQQEEEGWVRLPEQVSCVRTASLWDAYEDGTRLGRRTRRRFLHHFEALATAVCSAEGARGGRVARAVRPSSEPAYASSAPPAVSASAGGLAGLTALAGLTPSTATQATPATPATAYGRAYAEEYRAGAAPGHSTRPPGTPTPAPGAPGAPGAFGAALYGLAELAQETGALAVALRSETAVRTLERACRAAGALPAARRARVSDLLLLTDLLERALRPLSLDWYAEDSLGAVDLCHATAGGLAALPGLLAHHFRSVPLLVTEYGVRLRSLYLDGTGSAAGPGGAPGERDPGTLSGPVRAVLGGFHRELAAETYRVASLVTPGNAHARRWQERCGADPAKLRTVYPGMDAGRFARVGEATEGPRSAATRPRETAGARSGWDLVWVGRTEAAKDLATLLRAFVTVHAAEPRATLRIVGAPAAGPEETTYRDSCERLAATLFQSESESQSESGGAGARGGEGESDPAAGKVRASRTYGPVHFEDAAAEGADGPELAGIYAAADAVVLSSVVEGFPISLVEAMFCGRATVSTDVGAVVEVVGGTGLVVPPRDPEALAGACLDLLRDPARRSVLGAAARSRALELFTVEQNIAAFRDIYLDIVTSCPVPHEPLDDHGEPLPFGRPAETVLPVPAGAGQTTPTWAAARDLDTPAPDRRMEAAR